MVIQNFEPVDAAHSNAAWISRKIDTDTVGKVDLKNVASPDVVDAQKVIGDNEIRSNANETKNTEQDNRLTATEGVTTSNTNRITQNETDIGIIEAQMPFKADLVSGKVQYDQLPDTQIMYFGVAPVNPNPAEGDWADGSWRAKVITGKLTFERKDAGVWTKQFNMG